MPSASASAPASLSATNDYSPSHSPINTNNNSNGNTGSISIIVTNNTNENILQRASGSATQSIYCIPHQLHQSDQAMKGPLMFQKGLITINEGSVRMKIHHQLMMHG
jgi:hypothetical protein